MAQSIRSDCFKISRTEVGIYLEVVALFMQHGTFFCDESKARYNEMFVLTFYTLLI